MQGNYLEVGIAPNGGFGTTIDAPTGYHSRPASVGSVYDPGTNTFFSRILALGFVADYGKDGWSTGSPDYYGDYFLPGYPQEGFSIQTNGSYADAWTRLYMNNPSTGFSGTISGSNTLFTNTGGIKQATWQGTMGNLSVKQVTTLNDTDLFFTISVVLKNSGSSTISNVYYVRTVDPDNDWATSTAQGTTINKIQYQLPSTNDRVLVTARGPVHTDAYLGLGTRDCRARAFYVSRGNVSPPNGTSPQDVYNGTPAATIFQSGADTADQGIGIVFNLGNVAAGDSVTFSYAYILKEADLDKAINQTQPKVAYDGKSYSSGDTITMCQNGSGGSVDILNGDFYSWTWSPSTGLSTTSGTHNVITLNNSTPVTYTLTGASSMSSICASKTLTIRVEPNIIATPTVSPLTYCLGQTATAITATGTAIKWYTSATGGTAVTSITPSTSTAGTFTYYATQTIGGCESSRVPLAVTVYAAPAVTKPPINDTACINGTATFSITATGGNLSYQWQEDRGAGFFGVPNNATYSGANSPTLIINNVPASFNSYRYQCVLMGLCATATTISTPGRLEVITAPTITTQPVNTIVCLGLDDTLNVAASGIGLVYQWQQKIAGIFTDLVNNANFSGVNSPSLIITGATIANGGDYRCIVSNECTPPDTSDAALVKVSTIANIISQPPNLYLCTGIPLNLEVLTSGPITAYQWQMDDGTGWRNVTNTTPFFGAKSNLLRISTVSDAMDSIKFRCIVIGECITVYSNEINIWLYEQPRITSQPVDITVKNNAPAIFEVQSAGVGVKFRWQASFTGNSFVFINDNSVYSGTKTSKLTINRATYALNGTYYRCLLEETGSCNYSDTTTDTVRLWIDAPTSVTSIGADNSFMIYPNPVEGGQLYIQTKDAVNESIHFVLTNSVGEIVAQQDLNFNNGTASINVSALSPGVYIIQLTNKEHSISEKSKISIH
jgi:hypothetical protein